MSAQPPPTADGRGSGRRRLLEPAQRILVALLAVEIVVFAVIGTNFLTARQRLRGRAAERRDRPAGPRADAGDRQRRHRPLGRLADGPVGGRLRQALARRRPADRRWPRPLTLGVGALAGGLNGLLITRLRIPPLIVTLGSFSLFRGLAEGLTGGVDNFTNFPARFLFLGQGYLLGGVPTQLPIFVAVAVGVLGAAAPDDDRPRAWSRSASRPRGPATPGFRSSGWSALVVPALGAGRRAWRRSSTSPTSARPRPTPAPATSCWRSRRSSWAARRSSAAAAASTARCSACSPSPCLQNGLRLADLPAELAGVLTGALAAGRDRPRPAARAGRTAARQPHRSRRRRLNVKNSQVAVICAVILAAALIVAASNVTWSGRSARSVRAGDRRPSPARPPRPRPHRRAPARSPSP